LIDPRNVIDVGMGEVVIAESPSRGSRTRLLIFSLLFLSPVALRAETVPPDPVTSLSAEAGSLDGDLVLRWTSTGNDGLSGTLLAGSSFYIQYSTFSADWSTATAQVSISTAGIGSGDVQTYVVTGLNPGTTYYLRLWTSDESSNCSSLSEGATGWAQDLPLSAPSALSTGSVTGYSVSLEWTPPAPPANVDDRSAYRVYRSTAVFSSVSQSGVLLSSTVSHPGTAATVTGLSGETTYYFGVTAVDAGDGGNGWASLALESGLSTIISTRTATVPPAGISDLTALSGTLDGEVELRWTAPGDDGLTGPLAGGQFVVKYSSVQIIQSGDFDSPPFTVGSLVLSTATDALSPQRLLLTGLTAGATYWFAVKARDEVEGNYSVWTSSAEDPTVNTLSSGWAMDVAPAVPTGIAVSTGNGSVDLSWSSGPEPDLLEYGVHQSSWSDSDGFVLLGSVSVPGTSYQKTGLVNGNTYYYKLKVLDRTGNSSGYTAPVSAVPLVSLGAAPSFTGETVVLGSTTIRWAWTLTANATGYRVIQSSSGVPLSSDLGPSVTHFILSDLPVNSSQTVEIQAFNGLLTVNSAATSYFTLSAVPTGLSSPLQTVSTVDLEWSAAGNPSGTLYDVERSPDGSSGWTLRAGLIAQTTYQDSGLAEYTTYYYRVSSYNGSGIESDPSVVLSTRTAGVSPAAISNLAANPGSLDGTVQLVWTAPGDDGSSGAATAYVVKYATFDVTAGNFDEASVSTFPQVWTPKTGGLTEGLSPLREVTGLYPGTTYYFAMKAVDEAGFKGSWSTVGVNLERTKYAQDLPPPQPTGLTAVAGDHQITLTWDPLTGVPDLDSFRIHMDSAVPPADHFFLRASTSSDHTAYVITGLSNETTYSFKISVLDDASSGDFSSFALESDYSLTVTTITLDREAPSSITDLGAVTGATEGTIDLSWTSPGDDGLARDITAGRLRIAYSANEGQVFSTSSYQVDIATTVSPSLSRSHTLTGLTGGTTYYVRAWMLDEASNSAGLSNGATVWAQTDVTPPASITDFSAVPSWRRVTLSWTAPGDDDWSNGLTGQFRLRYSTAGALDGDAAFGAASSEVLIATTVAPGQTCSVTVTGLVNGTTYYFGLRAEDEAGNASTLTPSSSDDAVPLNQSPSSPSLGPPADSYVSSGAQVMFDWSDSSDGDAVWGDSLSYTLRYSTDVSFGVAVSTFTDLPVSSCSANLSGLLENLTVYWQVWATDADGAFTLSTPSSYRLFLNQTNTAPSAFDLVSPVNSTDVVTTHPTLDWTDSTDVDPGNNVLYRVDYTTVSNFGTYTSSAGIPVSYYQIPTTLAEDATYYWRVYAADGITQTLGTPSSFMFRVDAASSAPNSFSLSSPASGVRSTDTVVTFTWQASTDPDPGDSVTYNLVYSILPNFGSATTVSGLVQTSHTVTFSDNIPVYWYVEAQDAQGNKRLSSESQRYIRVDTVKEMPSSFELLQPTGSVIISTLKPFIQWANAVDPDPMDQVRYSLDLSNRADFVGVQGIPLTDNFFQVTNNLLDDTTYYWRVRAGGYQGIPPVLQDAEERLSATGIFIVNVINTSPQAFSLRTPADGAVLDTPRPVFDWEDALDADLNEVILYTLSVSTMSDFSVSQTFTDLSSSSYVSTASFLENRTYYWKVVARDKEGAETECTRSHRFSIPELSRPKPPTGISGTWASKKASFVVRWNAVTANTDGSPLVDLKGYRIYRSLFAESIGDSPALAELSPDALSYEDTTVNGADFFYAVRAVDLSNIESVNSMLVESRPTSVFVAMSEDREVQVLIESLAAQNPTPGSDNVVVQMTRRPGEETGSVLRSYELEVRNVSSDLKVDRFLFQRPVEVAFAVNPPASAPGGAKDGQARPVFSAVPALPANQMSIFWHNGVEFIKLGGTYDSQRKVVTVMSQRPGVYRLQQALQSTSFEVVQLWPTRIFTPNGDGVNDEMNFVYSNPKLSPVSGEIFDLYGGPVANLAGGKDGSSLLWDGKNSDGHPVHKGVYLYQIRADGKVFSGTIVVAK